MSQPEPNSFPTEAVIENRAPTLLLVDDDQMSRELQRVHLKTLGCQFLQASNGMDALEHIARAHVDLVLLDVMMPDLDGYQVLDILKSKPSTRDIPVIMVTGEDDHISAVNCIKRGAEDYVHKPFDPVLLQARVNACLDKKKLHDLEHEYQSSLERRVNDQVRMISEAQLAVIFAMSRLAESKDPETGAHLERMREYCRVIAVTLGKLPKYASQISSAFIDDIYAASPLHDIGKVGVPDHILLKPGKLTNEEWPIMQSHATLGGETLRAVDRQFPGNAFIHLGIQIAEGHHEKWDGSGYPRGLHGVDIPLAARILALGDVYDALTSKRCYKPAFTHAVSREILLEQRGKHFDPDVIDAFESCEEEFIYIRQNLQDADE